MDHSSGLSAAAAIQAALAAEEEAMQAVAACRAQAEQILDEARRRASEIIARSDAHISALHKASNKRIRKLEESIPGSDQACAATDPPLETALPPAVDRLAAWLTGQIDALPPMPPGVPT